MKGKILVIEDEKKLAELLKDYLKQSGYEVFCLYDGYDAVSWVRINRPDMIILDLMLPGRDGLDICKEIRTFSDVPVMIVTARVEEIDRLLGLEFGADDYICKPFSPREVVARVKVILKRTGGAQSIQASGLILDESRYMASFNEKNMELTAVEFKLFQFLAANPGRIFSREQLMDSIYPDQRIVSDRTIDSHIKKLRKKISVVSPEKELIHSVYGVGYKFEIN